MKFNSFKEMQKSIPPIKIKDGIVKIHLKNGETKEMTYCGVAIQGYESAGVFWKTCRLVGKPEITLGIEVARNTLSSLNTNKLLKIGDQFFKYEDVVSLEIVEGEETDVMPIPELEYSNRGY